MPNVSEISVKLAARFDSNLKNTLSQQLTAAVDESTRNLTPELQKLTNLLAKSFEFAPAMSQTNREFETLLKTAASGKFLERHIQQLEIFSRKFEEVGDTSRKIIADWALFANRVHQNPAVHGERILSGTMRSFQDEIQKEEANAKIGRIWRQVIVDPAHPDNAGPRQLSQQRLEAAYTRYQNPYGPSAAYDNSSNMESLRQQQNQGIETNLANQRAARLRMASLQNDEAAAAEATRLRSNQDINSTLNSGSSNRRAAAEKLYEIRSAEAAIRQQHLDQVEADRLRTNQGINSTLQGNSNNRDAAVAKLREIQAGEAAIRQQHLDQVEAERQRRNQDINTNLDNQRVARQRMIEVDNQSAAAAAAAQRQRVDRYEGMFNREERHRTQQLRQRDAILDVMQDGYRERTNRRPFMPGHNFRFASQQVGFGIDDAIQSYHYGGAGASIRAASNNLTAIAGMSIPNPMLAAGTVVALSIATAAMPAMLRSMGIARPMHEIVAKTEFNSEGKHYSALRKNVAMSGTATKIAGEISELENDSKVTEDKTRAAEAYIRFAVPNERFTSAELAKDPLSSFMLRRGMSASHAARFDEALKIVSESMDKGGPAANNIQVFAKQKALNSLASIANNTVQDRFSTNMMRSEGAQYRATDLNQFNSALKDQYALKVNDIEKSGRTNAEKDADKSLALIEYLEKKSSPLANQRSINSNMAERRSFFRQETMTSQGTGGLLGDLNHGYFNRADTYDEMKDQGRLSPREYAQLSAQNLFGKTRQQDRILSNESRSLYGANTTLGDVNVQYNQRMEDLKLDTSLTTAQRSKLMTAATVGKAFHADAAFTDLTRSNLGYDSPLVNLQLEKDRRDYNFQNDSGLTQSQKSSLLATSTTGYNRQRADIVDSMLSEHRVNNAVGDFQGGFGKVAKALEHEISQGGLTQAEADEATNNLKHTYIKNMKNLETPSGTERFTANANTVGSAADKELRNQMLGKFEGQEDHKDIMNKSLTQLIAMSKNLEMINNKLELQRIGL